MKTTVNTHCGSGRIVSDTRIIVGESARPQRAQNLASGLFSCMHFGLGQGRRSLIGARSLRSRRPAHVAGTKRQDSFAAHCSNFRTSFGLTEGGMVSSTASTSAMPILRGSAPFTDSKNGRLAERDATALISAPL